VFLLISSAGVTASAQDAALVLDQTIPLPGVEGRMDHLALDASGTRLWIAALQNNTVEVVGLEAAKQMARLGEPKEPQGICLIPDLDRIVVASGADGMVRAYDVSQEVAAVASGLEDADNVRYDSTQRHVYVGYGKGALAVLEANNLTKLGEIALDGHPESFQLEQQGRRVFVNVPTAKHVAVVDRDRQAVVARWPVTEANANYPMALDEANRRLLVVCRKPARFLALDTDSGKVVVNVECCADADDVFLDEARNRLYVSGGEGSIGVFERGDAGQYKPLQRVATRAGARTSLFDAKSGRLFVAVPNQGSAEAEIRVFRAP
jgi:hypothetical protein